MSPKKKTTASGVITFHTPLPISLLKSEYNYHISTAVCTHSESHTDRSICSPDKEYMTDVKDTAESRRPSQPRSTSKCLIPGKRNEASASQLGTRQERLSHASIRRLQVKMEAENQQVKEIIQPLLETETGFVKELERFLSQRDVAELRRREVQHKRWTERVWIPLQRRVEGHVSTCSPVEAKRRQSLYSHYLHHCNNKGFVFLDTYDLREYNPFLLNIKTPHYLKVKDPLYLHLHGRLQGKRAAHSFEAGGKYKLPQSNHPLNESVASQADILLWTSSNHPVSACGKTPARHETERRESSRLGTIPYSIRATSAPDGRCHQTSCWFSRCGGQQQPARLHQPLTTY